MSLDKLTIGFLGLITTLIGGWDFTLQVLLILMGVDIITGILKSLKTGGFTSKQFREGLMGKAGFIVALILCYQLDVLMGNAEPVIRTICSTFYIANEGTSIIENLGLMGVPVPKFMAKRLQQLKDTVEMAGDEADTKGKE